MKWYDCDPFNFRSVRLCHAFLLHLYGITNSYINQIVFLSWAIFPERKISIYVRLLGGLKYIYSFVPMVVMSVACVTDTLPYLQWDEIYFNYRWYCWCLYLISMYFQRAESLGLGDGGSVGWPLLPAQVQEISSRIQSHVSPKEFRWVSYQNRSKVHKLTGRLTSTALAHCRGKFRGAPSLRRFWDRRWKTLQASKPQLHPLRTTLPSYRSIGFGIS